MSAIVGSDRHLGGRAVFVWGALLSTYNLCRDDAKGTRMEG